MGGEFDDEIYVTITLGEDFSEQNYRDIQMVLNDYIRHEIEHIIDANEGGDIESPDNYLLMIIICNHMKLEHKKRD